MVASGGCLCQYKLAKQALKDAKEGEGFDIQKFLSKLPFTTTGIPGELHLPKHNFTGPGTNLSLRLNPDGTPKEWSIPYNRVDEKSLTHDLAYRDCAEDLSCKHDADKIML